MNYLEHDPALGVPDVYVGGFIITFAIYSFLYLSYNNPEVTAQLTLIPDTDQQNQSGAKELDNEEVEEARTEGFPALNSSFEGVI